MIFKTGMLYVSVVMQILLGSLGQGEPIKDHIELEPSDIKEMLVLESEMEAMLLAPQMLSTMVQRQSSFTNYPQITGYQLTPSNIIVYYDTSFFEQEDIVDDSEYDDYYYDDDYYDIEYNNNYDDDYYYEEPYIQTNTIEFTPLHKADDNYYHDSYHKKNYQK